MTDTTNLLATFIGTQVATLTLGTNLFGGRVRDVAGIPNDAVFVAPVGGPEPERTMGQTREFRHGYYNVFVRNTVWNTGKDIAQSVIDAFNGNTAVPSGMLDATPTNTVPVDKGIDDKNRFHFMVGVRTIHEETTT